MFKTRFPGLKSEGYTVTSVFAQLARESLPLVMHW